MLNKFRNVSVIQSMIETDSVAMQIFLDTSDNKTEDRGFLIHKTVTIV